jgi:putative addiction module component (TIGR02574 family)
MRQLPNGSSAQVRQNRRPDIRHFGSRRHPWGQVLQHSIDFQLFTPIESLDGPAEDPAVVEEAWRVEIERRVGEIDRGEVKSIPGDEVFAEVRRRLK